MSVEEAGQTPVRRYDLAAPGPAMRGGLPPFGGGRLDEPGRTHETLVEAEPLERILVRPRHAVTVDLSRPFQLPFGEN
jgi:hypothetical protein